MFRTCAEVVNSDSGLLIKTDIKVKEGYYTIKLERPHKPRTTGVHSQNTRFRGHCRTIAVQTGYTAEEVARAMKRMAVPVLAHRLIVKSRGGDLLAAGKERVQIVADVVRNTPVPV